MDVNRLCMGCMEEKGAADTCTVCGRQEGTIPDNPNQLSPRTVLHDQYLLGRVLGQGGFGITYLGWDMHLERKVAIKEYFPYNFATRDSTNKSTVSIYSGKAIEDFNYGLQKFLEEGKTLAKFQDHPGIVMVITFFRANNTGYLVMEYVDGVTFKEFLIQKGGKIAFDTALKILIPVMDALREIHGAHLLHRDISPDNIMISRTGQVKLLDFGAARYAMNEHTRSLSVVLKDGYAPEEQYRSRGKQGSWTDVYATAATIYRAVTGTVPPQALDRLAEDELPLPGKLGIGITPELEKILVHALAVRAPDRIQTIRELQDRLMNETGTRPETAPLQITPPPVKNINPVETTPPTTTEPAHPEYDPNEKTEAMDLTEALAEIDKRQPVQIKTAQGAPKHNQQNMYRPPESGSIQAPVASAPVPQPPAPSNPTPQPPTPSISIPPSPTPPPSSLRATSPPATQATVPHTVAASIQNITPPTESTPSTPVNDAPSPDAFRNENNVWERQLILGEVTLPLIFIPPGQFSMGASGMNGDNEDDEHPRHRVIISKGFWLGKFTVTQLQWARLFGNAPWTGQNMTVAGDQIPAVYVSWKDIQQFFSRLNAWFPNRYRLPTEAEWEYACRADSDTIFHFGNDSTQLCHYSWFYDNAMAAGERYAHPVGQKLPNKWGLYDMHGNINEWCQDYYGGQYPPTEPATDPPGNTMGSFKVARGGNWLDIATTCRSAKRFHYKPNTRRPDTGFRIVIEI